MRLRRLFSTLALATAALGFSLPASGAIIADIVWVIDTSGSMGDDITQVKQRITEFDTVMTTNGVDVRYGLVRFGGAASLIQNLTTFSDFTRVGGPFAALGATGGGTEDGSAALQLALTSAWRGDSVRNMILITDENDDDATNRASLNNALAGTVADELINIIGNPNDDDLSYYRNLAPANGGAFFNILDFRNNPGPFFTNFVNTKLQEIIIDFCTRFPNDPQCINQGTAPEPSSLALLGAGIAGLAALRRRRK